MIKLVGLGILVLAISAAVPLTVRALRSGEQPIDAAPRSTFSLAEAREFREFSVFNLGLEFQELPLVAVLRRADTISDPAEPRVANYVSFVYGDCRPTGEVGCASPLEVQNWPACVRSRSAISHVGLPNPQAMSVRGVPATYLEEAPGAARLELTTGRTTVVIFGPSRTQVVAAANRLAGVNVDVDPRAGLPAPALGALTGELSCQAGDDHGGER